MTESTPSRSCVGVRGSRFSRLGRHRHRRYGLEFRQALKVCWEASGYICSARLQPFLPELLPLLQRHGHLPREAGWSASR